MTILPPSKRRLTLDGYRASMRRQKHQVIAEAIRNGLMFALICHAVVTVLFAPNRRKP